MFLKTGTITISTAYLLEWKKVNEKNNKKKRKDDRFPPRLLVNDIARREISRASLRKLKSHGAVNA